MGKESDLFQRAVIALSDSDFERAEKLTQELIDMDKKNVDAWSLLANIHKQSGDIEKATEAAKQATNLDPKNTQHWNNLGHLYLLQSNWEEGEKCYSKAAKLPDPSPTIFLNHAWALIELGKEKEAQQQLKQALEQALEDTLSETIATQDRYTKLRPLLKKIK